SYHLRGVIYYGHAHFTARIVAADGVVWDYDGMRDESPVVWEADATTLLNMYHCGTKTAILTIYA
ncbi:hypothetical protein BD779DRAFT_1407271, partial [Infundibulicybe gibba]